MGNCEYDAAISAIPITDGLKQKMAFSDTYYTVGQVVGAQQNTTSATQ